jgi:hypothetical protein
MRVATCACGQLSARCTGEPALVSLCHCRDCQKRTGSAFGIAAFFARANVATGGQARAYTRTSDSGYDVTFHFCRNCGGTVFWEPRRKPDMVAVAVGSFADPSFPPPTQAVYDQHRHPWVSSRLS